MLINSVAFCNKAKGIDSNSCPDIQVTNSTSYNNGSYNVAFYTNDASNTAFLANGVISYRNDGGTDDQIKLKGSQDEANVYNESNYYMISGSSTNTESVTVDDSWFVSVDADAAIGSSMTSSSKDLICGITRNEDGSINMNGFLVLAESSGKNAGATVEGQNSEKIEVPTSEANMSKDTSEDLDGKFVRKWFNVYYQLSDGTYLTGLHKIEGNLYFFYESGAMARNTFITVSEKTYYFDDMGQAVKGFLTRWFFFNYYFDSNGVMVTNSFVTAGDSTYYFAADGLMVRYWQTIDGKQYYFGSDGKMVKGCIEMWWNIYVFDDNGVLIESHSIYERACNWANKRFGITIRI
jgi:glucan-binding YG repeat protein